MQHLDVLVVTYRSGETIDALVRSLPQLSSTFVVRLTVHDNSGDTELVDAVRTRAASEGIAASGTVCAGNCGFARACNEMAAASTADWLLFLNPDCRVAAWPPGWNPGRGVWGPVIRDASGRRQLSGGADRGLLTEWRLLFGAVKPPHGGPVAWVSGAALLVDRQSFTQLGGFSEAFFMYYEDVDLGLRAGAAGLPVTIEPGWVVEHRGGHSVAKEHSQALQRSYQSAIRFHRDRGRRWKVFALAWAIYCTLRVLRPKWPGSSGAFATAARRAWADVVR